MQEKFRLSLFHVLQRKLLFSIISLDELITKRIQLNKINKLKIIAEMHEQVFFKYESHKNMNKSIQCEAGEKFENFHYRSVLDSLLQTAKCSSLSSTKPRFLTHSELSLDARALHDSLPDIDFMRAAWISFPLKSDNNADSKS